MGMDALTLVRQNHRELEGLLDGFERRDGEAGVAALRAAIRQHVDQEESILYPIYRERARQAEADLATLDRTVEQHRLIDRLVDELAELAPDGDGVKAKLTVLTEQVRNHLDTENSVLLTAIEDLLDDDTLLELGRRMEQRARVIAARQELARAVVPRGRRLTATLGGLAAAALAAVLLRRRRPPPSRRRSAWDRIRRR
jgi:hemerythrin-like domain-containing protein